MTLKDIGVPQSPQGPGDGGGGGSNRDLASVFNASLLATASSSRDCETAMSV